MRPPVTVPGWEPGSTCQWQVSELPASHGPRPRAAPGCLHTSILTGPGPSSVISTASGTASRTGRPRATGRSRFPATRPGGLESHRTHWQIMNLKQATAGRGSIPPAAAGRGDSPTGPAHPGPLAGHTVTSTVTVTGRTGCRTSAGPSRHHGKSMSASRFNGPGPGTVTAGPCHRLKSESDPARLAAQASRPGCGSAPAGPCESES